MTLKNTVRVLSGAWLVSSVAGIAFGCSSSTDSPATGGQANGGAATTAGTTNASGASTVGGATTTAGSGPVAGASSAGQPGSGGSPAAGAPATGGAGAAGSAGASGAPNGGATTMGGQAGAAGNAGAGAGGGGAVTCPTTVLKPGDANQTVKVGSLDRTYVLYIPKGYTGDKALPLVVDFHPLGSTGAGWEGQSGWKAKADSAGFVVAYPNSYNSNNSWNVGMCCQDAQKNQIDDVAFTKAMIQQVEGLACIDPKRVYATGCSNGGGMTYKVACDLADMIAGAAPVDFRCVYGGGTDSPSCESCKPSRPVSVTHFDNTGDTQLVPYNGGTTSFAADCPPNSSCVGMAFPSAQDNFKDWQELAGCSGSTMALSNHAACQTNTSCMAGAQVTMCVQQGGSHCGNYGTLQIVDTAWEMFQKQALP